MRQKTLTQRERLLPLEHTPPSKRLRKGSTAQKRRTSEPAAVTPTPPPKLKNTATQTMASLCDVKKYESVSDDCPHESIVSINGYNLDYGRFPRKKDAPLFYGVVEDPSDHDDHVDLKNDELIVRFVVSGEYEWYDKNSPNVLLSNYKNHTFLCVVGRLLGYVMKIHWMMV